MKVADHILTVIIATFNSEKTLPTVLDALCDQEIKGSIEIIIVDGGSQDSTLKIAKKYKCTILHNPKTEPIYAKFIAYKKANGKYILYLDHDEVIANKNSLQKKINALQQNSKVKMVIGSGYRHPAGYAFINEYINEFGDPFSFFIYHLSKNEKYFINEMKKKYTVYSENNNDVTFKFKKSQSLPIIELVAGGSMFDAIFMKETFPKTVQDMELIPHFFYLILSQAPFLTITKNDSIYHYSSDTLSRYSKKIKWRIKNNIFHYKMSQSGFSGRKNFQPVYAQFKQYFYIPYAFSMVFPLFDSIYLSLSRKNIRYMIHFPLTLYTAGLIIYYYVLRLSGYRPALMNYDESKIVK